VIRSINDKTGHRVIVPINPRVNAILEKYGGKLPPKVADVIMNRYIKKIAEKAEIFGRVDYVITRGGKREEWVLERWEMISNHTARRTFITNALKAGVDPVAVMQLAGIKKYSTLMRYNKREIDETAEAMKEHSHFK
jgi:integrase